MSNGHTRSARSPRAAVPATRSADAAAHVEPKPGPVARMALSERVRAALRCASSAPFVATGARPHAEPAEPAPFICG